MAVDVITETLIARPPELVAAFAMNPDNAPRWYINIKAAQRKTPPPLGVGSRIAFVARFLGRQLVYTYEITALVPATRLVMRTSEGPFPMETTYEFSPVDGGRCRMRLRNRGTPSGVFRLLGPIMTLAMRRANRHDLARLKFLLEQGG